MLLTLLGRRRLVVQSTTRLHQFAGQEVLAKACFNLNDNGNLQRPPPSVPTEPARPWLPAQGPRHNGWLTWPRGPAYFCSVGFILALSDGWFAGLLMDSCLVWSLVGLFLVLGRSFGWSGFLVSLV